MNELVEKIVHFVVLYGDTKISRDYVEEVLKTLSVPVTKTKS